MDRAALFLGDTPRSMRKLPLLQGKSIVNLFFENSTRTRTTFEIAAKGLSADVVNLDISTSATAKGESLLDTLKNLEAMGADLFVVRHNQSGAPHFIAQHCTPDLSIVTPATDYTPTQLKRCWTCSLSASTRATSINSRSRLLVTFAIPVSFGRRSTP